MFPLSLADFTLLTATWVLTVEVLMPQATHDQELPERRTPESFELSERVWQKAIQTRQAASSFAARQHECIWKDNDSESFCMLD